MNESKQGRVGARCDEFKEQSVLFRGEVILEDLPKPANDLVIGMKSAKIFSIFAQIVDIYWHVVTGDQSLKLWRGKHFQPVRIDDGSETSNESGCLLVYLRVHSEM